jgi:hypothetical protein
MMDAQRKAAGDKLLAAAHEFWTACRNEGQYGAVQWLAGSNGELIVFTRGEYREELVDNIFSLKERSEVYIFAGEEMPVEDDI